MIFVRLSVLGGVVFFILGLFNSGSYSLGLLGGSGLLQKVSTCPTVCGGLSSNRVSEGWVWLSFGHYTTR